MLKNKRWFMSLVGHAINDAKKVVELHEEIHFVLGTDRADRLAPKKCMSQEVPRAVQEMFLFVRGADTLRSEYKEFFLAEHEEEVKNLIRLAAGEHQESAIQGYEAFMVEVERKERVDNANEE